MQSTTALLVWTVLAHLIADWLLQNEWMVCHKCDLRHPAGWVHGVTHSLLLALILAWPLALLIGFIHVLIDTRRPVQWWKLLMGKTQSGPQTVLVEMWVDQVMHVTVLAGVLLLFVA